MKARTPTTSHYPFQFGVNLVFGYRLNVTFVSCNVNLLFTDGAFSPTALVVFGSTSGFASILYFVGHATLSTFVVGETHGWNVFTAAMKMVKVTVLPKEGSVVLMANGRG